MSKLWTKKDIDTINILYSSKVPLQEIANRLQRTKPSVVHMASRLKLLRPTRTLHKWSIEDVKFLRELVDQGVKYKEISIIMNIPFHSVKSYICQHLSPDRRTQLTEYVSKRIKYKIVKMREQNKSVQEMATACGVSTSTIHRFIKELNIQLPEPDRKILYVHGELRKTHYNLIKKGARERSLEFSITPEYIWKIFQNQGGKCALSGVDLVLDEGRSSPTVRTASLDRIDSSIGYVKGNCQWVHKQVNRQKGSLSDKEFVYWCHLISSHNSKND